MSEVRAFAYRERASQAHQKAMRAGIPEATRRAWLIVERDWTRMAEQEELNDAMSWLDSAARSRREREVTNAAFPAGEGYAQETVEGSKRLLHPSLYRNALILLRSGTTLGRTTIWMDQDPWHR